MSSLNFGRVGARSQMALHEWRGATIATLMVLVVMAAHAHIIPDKRAEMSPVPFVMGSRYGRSSPVRNLSPRNDRFFMGGRYGKRSEAPPPMETLTRVVSPPGPEAGGLPPARALFCQYTGVYPLYRCVQRTKNGFDKRKSADDNGPGEEV